METDVVGSVVMESTSFPAASPSEGRCLAGAQFWGAGFLEEACERPEEVSILSVNPAVGRVADSFGLGGSVVRCSVAKDVVGFSAESVTAAEAAAALAQTPWHCSAATTALCAGGLESLEDAAGEAAKASPLEAAKASPWHDGDAAKASPWHNGDAAQTSVHRNDAGGHNAHLAQVVLWQKHRLLKDAWP